jgi:hypothetical protein
MLFFITNNLTHVYFSFALEQTTEAFELLGRGICPDGKVVLKVMVGPDSS